MKIRPYKSSDLAEWMRMRRELWPELPADEEAQRADCDAWLARDNAIVIVAQRADSSQLAGFIEVGEREFADGCETSPVAYLEGWFVDEDVRGQAIGRKLVQAAEKWAIANGYREFASDALLENLPSQRAHNSVGFVEVERAVRYAKQLRNR
ncbi:MAG TPA: GNAT family N-acetyltransferase [Bryocella sp.]|nr:GNAT family N-acetyltransferase [Bryocella sp.]